MRKCLAIVVLLLASTAAQAQYTFKYEGRTITIDPDRGTISIPGVYDNTGKKAKRSRSEDGESHGKKTPQQAKTEPKAAPEAAVPAAPAPAEQALAPAPAAAPKSEPSSATAAVAPAESAAPAAVAPAPQVQQNTAPVVQPEAAPVAAPASPAPAPAPQKQAVAPAAPGATPSNSPLGVWLTEEKEGKVRIEPCGSNLCGYSVDKKSNQNGEKVLIDMKPGKDKWSGRIHDPNTGSSYDSTIAMKGNDSLRVQGCAFGGMFCGGQIWTRVN